MVKTRVDWTSPSGERFAFEYEVTRNPGASSVRDVSGTAYPVASATAASVVAAPKKEDDGKGPRKKKRRKEEDDGAEAGYLRGYEITRGANGNKNFHSHADCVSGELQKFACSLYDSKGMMCRAPRGSPIRDILHMDGSMFLVEWIEIKRKYKGMDLGINFLHEYLAQPQISKRVGVVVMYPWAINERVMRYDDNIQKLRESVEGKSENEKVDIHRANTVKLRRQYARMGFAAVADTPDWVDSWFLSMEKYKRMEPSDVKRSWLSKEAAAELEIPMPARKHVDSERDGELKELLRGIMPDHDPYGEMNSGVRRQIAEMQQSVSSMSDRLSSVLGGEPLPAFRDIQDRFDRMSELYGGGGSKLTDEKKADIRRLVDAGADLRGINALHLAAAGYKSQDLFDLLIDEYGMDVEAFDEIGRRPIHVAACTGNADGVRILIAKGADKNAENEEGQTALQEVNQVERSLGDFGRAMFGGGAGSMMGRSEFVQVRLLS